MMKKFLIILGIILLCACNPKKNSLEYEKICGLWVCESDNSELLISLDGIRSSLITDIFWQKNFDFEFSEQTDIGSCAPRQE